MTQMICTSLGPYQKTGKKWKKSGRTTRIIDEPHLEFVRRQYCCVCGAPPRSHPHHVKHRSTNGSDRHVVPLCPGHHSEVHMSRRKFANKYNINLDGVAADFWTLSPANPQNQSRAVNDQRTQF